MEKSMKEITKKRKYKRNNSFLTEAYIFIAILILLIILILTANNQFVLLLCALSFLLLVFLFLVMLSMGKKPTLDFKNRSLH